MRPRSLFLLFAGILACGALAAYARQDRQEERTPFPHAKHHEEGLECEDCHPGAVDGDQAGMPGGEECFDCHSEPEEEGDAIAAFFKERAAGEGKLRLHVSLDFADLKFSHKIHAVQGAECADCHGDVLKGAIIQGGDPDFKHTCLDCHEILEKSRECATCHDTYRADSQPADHQDPAFMKTHGLGVKKYYRDLPEERCFFCHKVEYCDRCHKGNMPESHDAPLFLRRHGDGVRFDQKSLAEASCRVCHDRSGCNACHRQMEPRSHTVSFKNRTHGLRARLERQTCMVCHDQTTCLACHSRVEPISHRGQFNQGQQLHCLQCHLPLQANRCYVCHRQVFGHNSLPRPADATHLGATSNSCRICHSPAPHADNGMDCTICH